jgi:hypothetical protein
MYLQNEYLIGQLEKSAEERNDLLTKVLKIEVSLNWSLLIKHFYDNNAEKFE